MMDHAKPSAMPSELSPPGLTPTDLAELMGVMSSTTERLKTSHDALLTEVARLSRELGRANEQLERSRRLAALGEMAAGIAHEVRNPLASIGLYARLLGEDLADQPAQGALAGKITRAVRQAESIVQDVLSFAREIRVDPEPIDASELLDRACESAGAPRWSDRIAIRRADLDRPPVELRCDARLFEQALVNLIRNAVEAMLEHTGAGTLTLDALVEPGSDRGGDCALVRVIDSGPGVTPEAVDRMFNPFFTTRASGTGLGLAIVHRIIDAHHGRVRVGVGPTGTGTAIDLCLPACASAEASEQDDIIIEVRTTRADAERAA